MEGPWRDPRDFKRSPTRHHAQMKAPLSVGGVIAIAVLHIALFPLVNAIARQDLHTPPDSFLLIAAAIMLIPSVIFAYALPKIRVGSMSRYWHVPQHTYVLSRPLLCLLGTSMTGTAIGTASVGLLAGWATFAQGFIMALNALAFLYSANERCQRPAASEFTMVFWRSLFRFNL